MSELPVAWRALDLLVGGVAGLSEEVLAVDEGGHPGTPLPQRKLAPSQRPVVASHVR